MSARIAFNYRNDKLRACPSFAEWHYRAAIFCDGLPHHGSFEQRRAAFLDVNARLEAERAGFAYQAGPRGPLP